MGYDKEPVYSPDGSMIAWTSMETPGYESDKNRLFIYDFATKTKRYLTRLLTRTLILQFGLAKEINLFQLRLSGYTAIICFKL